MEKISAFSEFKFKLISHPDRTLEQHLSECDTISKKQLAMKHIVADRFFDALLIEKMRHLLVYFHDFGKATDYFQLKIIRAIEAVLNDPKRRDTEEGKVVAQFSDESKAYIADFNKTKRANAELEMDKNERLGNHAQIGSYFVQTCFQHEDVLLGLILMKVIRRHHGNLTNFFDAFPIIFFCYK